MDQDKKPRLNTQLLNMTADQIKQVDASKAEVVSRRLLSRIREITMTIRPDGVQFNNTCITAFENVVYIHFLVDREQKLLYIKPAAEYDKDSQRWCIIKEGTRKTRKITGKEYANRIYNLMGWSKGYYYRIPGAPAVQIGTDDDYLMVFELKDCDKKILTEKARHAAGVEDAELGNAYEQIQKEAKAAEEERKNPIKKKKPVQADFADDHFGVALENHVNRVVVPPLEQMAMDLELLTKRE